MSVFSFGEFESLGTGENGITPFMVQFNHFQNENFEQTCGGTIVTSLFIITAAQCLIDLNLTNYQIVAGQSSLNAHSKSRQIRGIKQIYQHPNTTQFHGLFINDISVIELDEPLEFNKHVQAINFKTQSIKIEEGMNGLVIGWNKTEGNEINPISKENLSLLSSENCMILLQSYRVNTFSPNMLICGKDVGKKSCQRNPGDPMICKDENKQNYLCGFVSFSYLTCENIQSITFFTSVAYNLEWMESIIFNGTTNENCLSNEFQCNNGQCQNLAKNCDGFVDCIDGSDEFGCPNCSLAEFRCKDGNCINSSLVCNTQNDCSDWSDEIGCKLCSNSQFSCKTTDKCIEMKELCNGQNDCSDGSDEVNCTNCTQNEFRCKNSNCINLQFVCDGENDCKDGSDETNCYLCQIYQFRCSNFKCVNETKVCDGINDCGDGSDETGCDNCKIHEFNCHDGKCIDRTLVCNSQNNCKNGTDEIGCKNCSNTQFQCFKTKECINQAKLCDGANDCKDGSDEFHCGNCETNEFKCSNGDCIDSSKVCNSLSNDIVQRTDCSDRSDEVQCFSCEGNQFKCHNYKCIFHDLTCNGENDCGDGTDEINCLSCGLNEFKCKNGKCLTDSSLLCNSINDCGDFSDELGCERCNSSEFYCPMANDCTPKIYLCDGENDCYDGLDEAHCGNCTKNQFKCRNGNCISLDLVCDRDNDCKDGSDEANCKTCLIFEFRCKNDKCIDITSTCNGTNECGDGSDELNCGNCTLNDFRCENGDCVDASSVCNSTNECTDGSDEKGCPATIKTSNGKVKAYVGENININGTKFLCDEPINNLTFVLHATSFNEFRCYSLFEQAFCSKYEWLVMENNKTRCRPNPCYNDGTFKNIKNRNFFNEKTVFYNNECVLLGSNCEDTGVKLFDATENQIKCLSKQKYSNVAFEQWIGQPRIPIRCPTGYHPDPHSPSGKCVLIQTIFEPKESDEYPY